MRWYLLALSFAMMAVVGCGASKNSDSNVSGMTADTDTPHVYYGTQVSNDIYDRQETNKNLYAMNITGEYLFAAHLVNIQTRAATYVPYASLVSSDGHFLFQGMRYATYKNQPFVARAYGTVPGSNVDAYMITIYASGQEEAFRQSRQITKI